MARQTRVTLLVATLLTMLSAVFVAPAFAQADPIGGSFENTVGLPDGGLAVSDTASGLVRHFLPDGSEVAPFASVADPGGLAVAGNQLFYAGGSVAGGVDTGSIHAINLASGQDETIAEGISAPNGLAVGDRVCYTTSVGFASGVYCLNGATPQRLNTPLLAPNGLAVGADGRMFVSDTIATVIYQLDAFTGQVWPIGGFTPLVDDLTVGPNGLIYAASQLGIYWVNPIDGAFGLLSGLVATAVKQTSDGLVAVTRDGNIFHL